MHAHSQAHERDRPGRPGWRLASQFPPDMTVTGWRVAACRKSFRRDAENAVETTALVRLRMSVHRRVEVPLWRCFPLRVESNCVLVTGRGEQLEAKG